MTGSRKLALAAALCVLGLAAGAQAAGENWVRFARSDEGSLAYDRASVKREGDRVRYTLRIEVAGTAPRTLIGAQEMDCAKQTNALLTAQEFGAGGELLRSVTVPADRVERAPFFAGDEMAKLYRLLCPKGARLPKFVPGAPPIQVVPQRQ